MSEETQEADKSAKPVYRRVLLKLSGEALMGEAEYGIDPAMLKRLAEEIAAFVGAGDRPAVTHASQPG